MSPHGKSAKEIFDMTKKNVACWECCQVSTNTIKCSIPHHLANNSRQCGSIKFHNEKNPWKCEQMANYVSGRPGGHEVCTRCLKKLKLSPLGKMKAVGLILLGKESFVSWGINMDLARVVAGGLKISPQGYEIYKDGRLLCAGRKMTSPLRYNECELSHVLTHLTWKQFRNNNARSYKITSHSSILSKHCLHEVTNINDISNFLMTRLSLNFEANRNPWYIRLQLKTQRWLATAAHRLHIHHRLTKGRTRSFGAICRIEIWFWFWSQDFKWNPPDCEFLVLSWAVDY